MNKHNLNEMMVWLSYEPLYIYQCLMGGDKIDEIKKLCLFSILNVDHSTKINFIVM